MLALTPVKNGSDPRQISIATESRSVVASAMMRPTKGTQERLGVKRILSIFTAVMVSWVYAYIKADEISTF